MNQVTLQKQQFSQVYIRRIWLNRFCWFLAIFILMQLSIMLPISYCILIEFFAIIILYLAFFYFYEYLRLVDFSNFYLDFNGVHYWNGQAEVSIAFSEIDITFLYYSSLDKSKGSATFCLRFKNGNVLRFAGLKDVDQLLIYYKQYSNRIDKS